LFLASELESIDPGIGLDLGFDAQFIGLIARYGVSAAIAGLMLSLFDRLEQRRRFAIWSKLSPDAKSEILHLVIRVQPQMAVKLLTPQLLADVLSQTDSAWLHDRIAEALSAIAVPDSELCLSALMPSAQRTLASILAERAGRVADQYPDWIVDSAGSNHRSARLSFTFGVLSAGRKELFAKLAADISREDWEELRLWLRQRAFDLSSDSVAIFLRHAPALSEEYARPQRDSCQFDRTAETTSKPVPSAILARARQATGETFYELLGEAGDVRSPTWRKDIERALLSRAIKLKIYISRGMFPSLAKSDICRELVIHRLLSGRLSLLRRITWNRIDLPTRFTLLQRLIRSLQIDEIPKNGPNTLFIAGAIADMPDPVRKALASQFIESLGHDEETDVRCFEVIHEIVRDDHQLLASIARALALRGQPHRSRLVAGLASDALERASGASAIFRLRDLLGRLAEFPANPVEAIVTILATLIGEDFKSALRLCSERLAPEDIELVIADLISRSRATEVLVEAI